MADPVLPQLSGDAMVPRATMRLQLHKDFTFADAERVAPYLAALGISHVYASPITTARAGSMHGYDVIDPTRVNPEVGGEETLRRLVATLRAHGMGLIVDIVPNHMANSIENPWWLDVLQHGRGSRYAATFDIDWEAEDPALRGKVLLPFLGRPYGEAIAAGEIKLSPHPQYGFVVRYFDDFFPIAERDHESIERLSPAGFDPAKSKGRTRLDRLLHRQHYRLAWWRVAGDEIDYRRFFNINQLVGLRMEDEETFERVHALIFRLYAEGLIDGVRIDHVDGLADPASYCRKLRQRLDELTLQRPPSLPLGRPYLIVEKILLRGETLAQSWNCDGTSGYDFMNQVNALQHAADATDVLDRLWNSVSGRPGDFSEEERTARREIIARSFTAQLQSCATAFQRLALGQHPNGDLTRAAIERAIVELLVHFPVYRTYATASDRPAADKPFLAAAMLGAKATAISSDNFALDRLYDWLDVSLDDPELKALQEIAVTRFQQLSAPIAAKAVEDTAAYRYGRLLSRNDVGFEMARLGGDVAEFHREAARRQAEYPRAMLATATHDHKRGEDVRARLAVISEIAEEWAGLLPDWVERSNELRQSSGAGPIPTTGDIAMLLQTIVGCWPLDLTVDDDEARNVFAERLAQWQQKALREAKLFTDWRSPRANYEQPSHDYLMAVLADRRLPRLLDEIVAFVQRIAPAGAVNGLAQVLLKLASPGMPDIYQGTEFWDFSLVDPDNRRTVDFVGREASLGRVSIDALTRDWHAGHIKQALIARVLAIRTERPALFAQGSYEPLQVEGEGADHVVAFARRDQTEAAIAVAPRLPYRLLRDGEIVFDPARWGDTCVVLGDGLPRFLIDALAGRAIESTNARLPLGMLLQRVPVALLLTA